MFTKLLTIPTSLESSIVITLLEQNNNFQKNSNMCLNRLRHKRYISSVNIQVSEQFFMQARKWKRYFSGISFQTRQFGLICFSFCR